MPEHDQHFIMGDEDPNHNFDPAGFKKANVGATRGTSMAGVKYGALALVLVLGWWLSSVALKGAAFEVEGASLRVPEQGWQATLPTGWKAERGTSKAEIVAFPGSVADVRAATRAGTWVRFTTGDDGSAKEVFGEAYTKTQGRTATFTELQLRAGKAVRAEEPAQGRVSIFIDGSPSILLTAPTAGPEVDAVAQSLVRGAKD